MGRSNQLESPPPKGLLQRIRAHGISESTTTHSRPKSQASHTAKFDSGLLFTQSRSFVQPAWWAQETTLNFRSFSVLIAEFQ